MSILFEGKTGEWKSVPSMRTVDDMSKRGTRETKEDYVCLIPGPGTLLCRHCGDHHIPNYPIEIKLLSALLKAFGKSHRKCKLGANGLACVHCFSFGHEMGECWKLAYGGDPHRWAVGPDTGLSSKTIWRKMMGVPGQVDVPHDPDDFGRCHRLLSAIPGWRDRIGEMSTVPGWESLAPAWSELEALYLEELPSGRLPKLYARMKELLPK